MRVRCLTATMGDVAPSKDAFVELMAAVKDPWYTAVLYRAWLEHVDESEPLWRVPYFGQVVRSGTAEEIFAKRKREHEADAVREDKDLGLHAVIDMYGSDAIVWKIVSCKSGPRTAMQELANAEEIRLIDENGGMLRDMDGRLKQTLNLTKGGKGDARAVWAAIDARRRRLFSKFKAAMEEYVTEHGSALVPVAYVDADGYQLGVRLHSFRLGEMRQGMPEEKKINAWAEALTKWSWNARDTDEWRQEMAQLGLERSRRAFDRFKPAMEAYVNEHKSALVPTSFVNADGYRLGKALHKFRLGRMREGPWKKKAVVWAEALPKWEWDARKSDEYQKERSQRARLWRKHETAEQKASIIAKFKETTNTNAFRAKRSKVTKGHMATKRRAELVRARPIAVPFEQSKKRRVAMRAASTDFLGIRGNAVLYMVSEDGETIRRVAPNGGAGKEFIVGPVVDPAPPDAFDSD